MKSFARDQADGLRRMLMRQAGRCLLVAAAPEQSAMLLDNLVVALGTFGRDALAIDGSVLAAQPDAGREALADLRAAADILLVTCGFSAQTALALGAEGDQMLLLCPDTPDGIKQSYLLLKSFAAHQSESLSVHVVIVGARSAESALRMYGNLAATVKQYLGTGMAMAGYIPVDTHLEMAGTLGKPVVNAFPAAPASIAFRQVAREIVSWTAAESTTASITAAEPHIVSLNAQAACDARLPERTL